MVCYSAVEGAGGGLELRTTDTTTPLSCIAEKNTQTNKHACAYLCHPQDDVTLR
jgi:hypothetical protein